MINRAKEKVQVLLPDEVIEKKIFLIRGEKVMLDRDLAALYGVETKVLNQAVKRNARRFPEDFMFQLDSKEFLNWRSQIVTSNREKMGIRRRPYAFTENGVAMLSSVLNSTRAIQVNIQIMRTFTRLRRLLASHKEILRKLTEHEFKLHELNKNVVKIFEAINAIVNPSAPEKKRRIGFLPPGKH